MRKSKFAGSFYPDGKAALSGFVDRAIASAAVDAESVKDAASYVAPHAGYEYSGRTAAFTYKAMLSRRDSDAMESVLLVGPNHTGRGAPIAVSTQDWETPLGVTANDVELSEAIAGILGVAPDEAAHAGEHSIEVQLPFLQAALPGKKACFICLGDQSVSASEALADAVIRASEGLGRKMAVLASSDFDHYEAAVEARKKDSQLLDALERMDYMEFNRRVQSLDDSICGFGPITVAMLFASSKGAKSGMVLDYSNSGDATGDYSSVVAYSSIAFI